MRKTTAERLTGYLQVWKNRRRQFYRWIAGICTARATPPKTPYTNDWPTSQSRRYDVMAEYQKRVHAGEHTLMREKEWAYLPPQVKAAAIKAHSYYLPKEITPCTPSDTQSSPLPSPSPSRSA